MRRSFLNKNNLIPWLKYFIYMELQLILYSEQTAPNPYWTPILPGTMKLASYLWHLCCCFHFHWVIAGILGPATLSLSLNVAQELLPGIQRRLEETVLLQVSGQIVCSFVFFHAFKFVFDIFTCFASGTCMLDQSAKLIWDCWELVGCPDNCTGLVFSVQECSEFAVLQIPACLWKLLLRKCTARV